MQKVISVLLFIVGIIHLLPVSGVFSAQRLFELYGVALTEPNLEILMRHRAVLFGLLGAFFIFSAFKVQLRLAAAVTGLISVVSFIVLAYLVGDFNSAVQRVVVVDIVAALLLLIVLVLHFTATRNK